MAFGMCLKDIPMSAVKGRVGACSESLQQNIIKKAVMEFEPVIGLEIHIQLNTKTKIFCGCSTQFGSMPNTQLCPICLGLPGVLPVLNEEALKKAILAGLALNCKISKYSKFDRKNYFYADLPKSYQLTQFNKPLCYNGYIDISTNSGEKRIGITRVHLEEDAGKAIHSKDPLNRFSMLDFNRSGVPLIEIVSDPDIKTPDEAYNYLKSIKSIMKYLNVSDCNMEQGSLRCDVNISLREHGEEIFGDKVEIKNLNSFKAVKMSLDFEIRRQNGLLADGKAIHKETRLWDSKENKTFTMRAKEDAHDYRYFPDPDLTPIFIDDEMINEIDKLLPELPREKLNRFIAKYNLPYYDAEILTSTKDLADYFELTVKKGANPKRVSNWILSEMLAKVNNAEDILSFAVSPNHLSGLINLIGNNTISGKIAKSVFEEMIKTGNSAEKIVEEKGLKQLTDIDTIEKMIDKVIDNNLDSINDYRKGKEKAFKFLMGQIMKETKGKANPKLVNILLIKRLKS